MSEHMRTTNHRGDVYQWVDTERFVIVENLGGLPRVMHALPTLEEALRFAGQFKNGTPSFVIVKLACVAPYKVEQTRATEGAELPGSEAMEAAIRAIKAQAHRLTDNDFGRAGKELRNNIEVIEAEWREALLKIPPATA